MEQWCSRILNWNRHVFDGGDLPSEEQLGQAKEALITAFASKTGHLNVLMTHSEAEAASTVAKPIEIDQNKPWWTAVISSSANTSCRAISHAALIHS